MAAADTFPRQSARTRRFTLGQPRTVTVSPDGARVLFLRSPAGDDPRTGLWCLDVATGFERQLVDPTALPTDADEDLPAAERARRERARETSAGVVGYATDRDARLAAFALSGRLFTVDVSTGATRELPAAPGVVDPRPDPTGTCVGYLAGPALRVCSLDGEDRELAADPEVSWGAAEFVAGEEMGRQRGYWWAPDGTRLLAARVDEREVRTWWIAAPVDPAQQPVPMRYPAAGTPNAEVTLWVLGLDGTRREVRWDRAALPYLTSVSWPADGGPLVGVMSRDQRRHVVLGADPDTGATTALAERTDPHWVDLVPGVPARLPDGRLVLTTDDADTHRLTVGGSPVTPPGLQVREVVSADEHGVVFTASTDPVQVHVWRWTDGGLDRLTGAAGVHGAVTGGGVTVVGAATLERPGTAYDVVAPSGRRTLASHAETPLVRPRVTLATVGVNGLRVGVLLPTGHAAGSRLPVLLDPYGGPHAQRVLAAHRAWLEAQWWADQGFAVVVADGRGTPGRGPAWERAIHGDLAGPVLDDQVTALHAVAAEVADLDLDRVAIRGWSFGGYLAALAVLRRPDVFHAAVAGAPVTDWRLYDTFYTERYLGVDPAGADAAAYDASSLLGDASRLRRPLLLVHGLADDNVVAAHTLQLSRALLEHGRPHSVLPLSGVTHMTPQESVAENLLLLQLDFLRTALGLT